MVMVQIRDVPEDVHAALKRRAELEGKSLNKLLLDELRQIARRGRNHEVLEQMHADLEGAKVPSSAEIVEGIRAIRDFAAGGPP